MRDMDVKILTELKKILPDPPPSENNRNVSEEQTKRRTKK